MKPKQVAQLVVDLLDEAHVDGDDLGAYLVTGERARHALAHECAIDGMGIAPLLLRAHDRQHIVAART